MPTLASHRRPPLAVHFSSLLLLLLALLLRACVSDRVPGSPYPVCARGLNASTTLHVVYTDGLSADDSLSLLSLQGALSKAAPTLYRCATGSPYELWANVTAGVWGVALDYTYAAGGLHGALAAFSGRLTDGYVLASLTDGSANVALAVAAARSVLVVTPANEAAATGAGLRLLYDVRGRDGGWALDTLNGSAGFTFARRVAVWQDASKAPCCMGDYAVAAGAFQFWDAAPDGALATRVVTALAGAAPFTVLGWGPDELGTVGAVSAAGGGVVASDWASGVDVLCNYDIPAFRQKAPAVAAGAPPAAPEASAAAAASVAPVHTVSFLMTDGVRPCRFHACISSHPPARARAGQHAMDPWRDGNGRLLVRLARQGARAHGLDALALARGSRARGRVLPVHARERRGAGAGRVCRRALRVRISVPG